jgi:hypothetical protein
MVFKLENICGTAVGSKANDGGASRWCSYSVNFQVRFLEGWPPAMGAGHSAFKGKDFHSEKNPSPPELPCVNG